MLTANERAVLVEGIVANCDCWDREDVDVLNVFDDSKLQKLHAHALAEKGGVTTNTTVTTNAPPEPKKPQTDEEWFLAAPPGIQAAVRNAMQIELNEKEQYVQKLTANAEEATKGVVVNVLRTKPLAELKMLASLIPDAFAKGANVFGLYAPSYSGASGGPPITANTGNRKAAAFDKDDILPRPVMNWSEISKQA